jgi:hypothetical protein
MLVAEMAAANPLWGARRIHGELRKLGIVVSERTVSRLLRRRGRPPSQTWRTFVVNHVASLASMDFFAVPTLTGRVLFVSATQLRSEDPVFFDQIRHDLLLLVIQPTGQREEEKLNEGDVT